MKLIIIDFKLDSLISKGKRNFIFLLLLSLFVSCGINLGNRVDSPNLKVYYSQKVTKNQAIDFSNFWQLNGMVGNELQTIRISSIENVIHIQLIQNRIYNGKVIDINEISQLQELERNLEKEVFDADVSIIICNDKFEELGYQLH